MSSATSTDEGLRPWQFFLLAGMLSATGVVLVATGQSPASIIVLSLTVVSVSFVALGAYRSLAPLVTREGGEMPVLIVGRTRAALEREKTLVVRAIKELEFDYAMKKIAKQDYEEMSARLRARAIGLMKQLDEGGYREAIEREIARRTASQRPQRAARTEGQGVGPGQSGDMKSGEMISALSCECGASNDHDARFCKSCGAKLTAA